jgi:hypothetical protein
MIGVVGILLLILVGFVVMVEQPASAEASGGSPANSANLPFALTPITTGTVSASPMPTGTVVGTVMPTPVGTTHPLTIPIYIPIISK